MPQVAQVRHRQALGRKGPDRVPAPQRAALAVVEGVNFPHGEGVDFASRERHLVGVGVVGVSMAAIDRVGGHGDVGQAGDVPVRVQQRLKTVALQHKTGVSEICQLHRRFLLSSLILEFSFT